MITYNLKSLVKQKTCFKNPDNPSCIGLILINSPRSFQDSCVFETGLSDFHKLTTTVLKQYFPKPKPKIVTIGIIEISEMMTLEQNLTTRYWNTT